MQATMRVWPSNSPGGEELSGAVAVAVTAPVDGFAGVEPGPLGRPARFAVVEPRPP
jgi:hypothetical protein